MRLLLDTHVWLWSTLEPERLGRRAREALCDAHAELWISPISVWEAALLFERGRLTTKGDRDVAIDQLLHAVPAREAPLTYEVAKLSCRVDLPHRDPADRFLVASALAHGLTLVTADQRLLVNPACEVLSAQ
ncbi:MAG: type II toxin-antitoxin system VapC family toxin [Gemmatimonadaceae bacterium]